jgi:cytochrome c-type biogenesis protein CcsB
MNSESLLSGVALIYLLAWFGYVVHAASRWAWMGWVATLTLVVAWALNTVGFILRWVESYRLGHGRIPISNQYESMILFAWTIAVLYLLLEIRYRTRYLGAFVVPLPFLSLGLGSLFFETDIRPLLPALQSNWLTAHVITCFLGYAGFALSFGVSVLYLVRGRFGETRWPFLPTQRTLDEINYRAIAVGFPFLSLGIITGAVWADVAWGTYWSWDPKETWSLITWFVYAFYLHVRFIAGWAGRRTATVSIVGFASVIFTYLGVNYLLSGLHSYA